MILSCEKIVADFGQAKLAYHTAKINDPIRGG